MNNSKREILVIVEGERTDIRLMEHLFQVYGIDSRYNIVSYNTNIYALYNSMFIDATADNLDILLHLKSREPDAGKKKIFDRRYSEILLVFDFEPHDPQFSESKIREMLSFFCESTDMGRLYINYPMAESFYHMKSIPDKDFNCYYATMDELRSGGYKARVNRENRDRDYRKFAIDKSECDIVIRQNIDKAWFLTKKENTGEIAELPALSDILEKQLDLVATEHSVVVLCTCAFYIVEYNPGLLSINLSNNQSLNSTVGEAIRQYVR